jgi:hypothetical protein
MIVLNDRPGQMCNRIWAFAPFVAFALQHRTRLLVPFFGEYAGEFPQLQTLAGVHFASTASPAYLRAVRRLFRILRSLPPRLRSFLRIRISDRWGHENWDRATLTARFSTVFLAGWTHPAVVSDLRPWREDFRRILRPPEAACAKAEAALARARRHARTVVGIHLRRADYRAWAGGRYSYSDGQYATLMSRISDRIDGPTAFLLCSNEPVEARDFPGLAVFSVPQASGVEDLYALSRCDFIAGPPSTYSMWASFYGEVPLYIVEDADRPVALADFSPIVALNRFADGHKFSLQFADDANLDSWFRAE